MYILSPYAKTVEYESYIILCNVYAGNYVKVLKQYYEALLELNTRKEDLIKDAKLGKLCRALIDIGFFIDKNSQKEKLIIPGKTVYISVTNRCNLSCIHCCTSATKDQGNVFSTNEIKLIIEKVIEISPTTICFTGGEPLIRNDMLELLQFTRKNFKGKITLSTNGTLINKNNIEGITVSVDKIDISIDGYDEETSARIRGSGVFEKCLKAADLLHKYNFTNISFSMIVTKYTYKSLEKFNQLCEKYQTKPLLRTLQPFGRGEKSYNKLRGEMSIDESDLKVGCRACFPGKKELHISYDGKIYPCGGTFGIEEFSMGNIMLLNIEELVEQQQTANDIECLIPYRSWNCEDCLECSIKLFCPLCLGEKYTLKKNKNLEENYCMEFRKKMEKALRRELCNE
ncbi:radical SAM protein [Clostridium sp. E02]|uniref:radical SAM protein n=1 Tax=Clostridium sp. E02 TaxID=2487134 RepID=UPI0013DE32B8|nr:radical SAM protein [Clostridium sp. E02]